MGSHADCLNWIRGLWCSPWLCIFRILVHFEMPLSNLCKLFTFYSGLWSLLVNRYQKISTAGQAENLVLLNARQEYLLFQNQNLKMGTKNMKMFLWIYSACVDKNDLCKVESDPLSDYICFKNIWHFNLSILNSQSHPFINLLVCLLTQRCEL